MSDTRFLINSDVSPSRHTTTPKRENSAKKQVDIHYQTETNRARIVRKKLHHDIVDSVSRYRRV